MKKINKIIFEDDLKLDSGLSLQKCEIAFETYGKLNKNKSNAIFICHALSGDQYCSGISPITKKEGWWNKLVGPGKPINTKNFFVICSNVIGGCQGSTGPSSINPKTGKRYDLTFPVITISDMVKAQIRLVDYFKIDKLFAVIGGSMGGMQALEWGVS